MSKNFFLLVCTILGFAAAVFVDNAFSTVVPPDIQTNLTQTAPQGDDLNPLGLGGLPEGETQLVVRLKDAPLAVANGANSKVFGGRLTPDQQWAYLGQLKLKQDALMQQIAALGGREIGRVSKAHNALMVAIDSSRVGALKSLPNVAAIRPVVDYQMFLSETVPHIGSDAAQAAGITGSGVTIAVLDSGIDYTHRNFGGAGTVAAYQAAYGTSTADSKNTTLDGLFPTVKVVGGYDFVGESWPNGPLAPDPDPIDVEGHGTHVADIAAGLSADGTHKGVAPGASLLAVKTCSSVSTSCSGIALLQGMDFALDPNGDGDISDAVDVINLSLGTSYGQREDDLSQAVANATTMGVAVVASAGNSADRPYIVGSPSSTPQAISVAQTQVPSALTIPLLINSPASIADVYSNTATVDWAPIGTGFTGNVAYVGRGCSFDTYLDNPAGKVALIDRGACDVSLKVDRAASAGAIGVLIGLVASGDASSFSLGGGSVFVPTLIITQTTSIRIRGNIAAPVNVSVLPANAIPMAMSMVASSSRGPGYSYNSIKPDIGAPGASVSAVAGSGNGEQAFGGTSGAAPMVSGAAALLLQAIPGMTPTELKARLMNNAETNILINPATQPGVLAEVTRIGGGEVRVNAARLASAAAWDAGDPVSTSLSFGYHPLTGTSQLKKKVLVRNYKNTARTLTIAPGFRYADDAASGAVTLAAPGSITVPANGSATFVLTATVNANLLPFWDLNGGSRGGDGYRLRNVEFDGYLTLSDAQDTIRLPWHILPHKAANVRPAAASVALGGGTTGTLGLTNAGGAVTGRVDVFSLTGTSPPIPFTSLPKPGDNFAIIDLKAVGVRYISGTTDYIQFAITTYGQRSHPNYPAEFDFYIDTNRDGTYDFVVFNNETGGVGITGQNVVTVRNLSTSASVTRFYTDADLDSANVIFTTQLSDLGLTPSTQFNFLVTAGDNYYTGQLTDVIGTMTYQLDTPRYTGTDIFSVPINGNSSMAVSAVPGGGAASPSQTGLLLMYRDAKTNQEANAITVTP